MKEIDEAIKHCLEVAEEQSRLYSLCPCPCDGTDNCMSLKNGKDMGCTKCAAEHRQLVEWLTELKEAKRLLKAAVEDFAAIAEVHAAATPILCPQYGKYMKAIDIRTHKWQYADEALKLLGGDTNE